MQEEYAAAGRYIGAGPALDWREPVEDARKRFWRFAHGLETDAPALAEVRNLQVGGADGILPARLYTPFAAGVDGLAEGAALADLDPPKALAVTILTSDSTAPPHILPKRVQIALEGGCKGIICAASDIHEAKQLAPRMIAVVPGIRQEGTATHDQARAATPQSAIEAGADLLVIGRAVTAAENRIEAAEQLVSSIS